ncbi:MAG: DUF1501 domain-containing protein [Planctomycetes bacterium]|nr:DUF1501 domain-containing protein [Planctomycetota bacterium]
MGSDTDTHATQGGISRRQVLQAGTLPLLGLGLPRLLAANAPTTPKSCIFIFQYGGLSQLDSWDPKPTAAAEVRGPYQPISTSVPGFQVGELMPRLATLADRYAVIRSMSHSVPVHDVANKMLLAGQSLPAADAPSFGAVVSKLRPATTSVPAHVWLQKFGGGAAPPEPAYLTGGFLGMAHSPLLIGDNHDDHPANPQFRVKSFDTADGVTRNRLDARRQLLAHVEAPVGQATEVASTPTTTARGPASHAQFRERAFDLLAGSQARKAFDIQQEAPTIRDRYGRHPLGQNLLLARRLVEAGVRLVNVVAWTGLAPGEKFMSVETWDMHGNAGIDIFANGWNGLGWALPKCDEAVSALLEDLSARGLLDSTLVVLVGEFGRTPRISKGSAAIGRDHWPNCYSAMVAGAGIRGGAIYGASDQQAAYVKDRPVSPEDFAATLFHAMNIPPETRISPDGFTRPASTGQVIADLFA